MIIVGGGRVQHHAPELGHQAGQLSQDIALAIRVVRHDFQHAKPDTTPARHTGDGKPLHVHEVGRSTQQLAPLEVMNGGAHTDEGDITISRFKANLILSTVSGVFKSIAANSDNVMDRSGGVGAQIARDPEIEPASVGLAREPGAGCRCGDGPDAGDQQLVILTPPITGGAERPAAHQPGAAKEWIGLRPCRDNVAGDPGKWGFWLGHALDYTGKSLRHCGS